MKRCHKRGGEPKRPWSLDDERFEIQRRQVLDVLGPDGLVLIFDFEQRHYRAVDGLTAFRLLRNGTASLEEWVVSGRDNHLRGRAIRQRLEQLRREAMS